MSTWKFPGAIPSKENVPDASVVAIGISSLLVTPDNYGYMGPLKAAALGSTSLRVVHDADVPVTIVHGRGIEQPT